MMGEEKGGRGGESFFFHLLFFAYSRGSAPCNPGGGGEVTGQRELGAREFFTMPACRKTCKSVASANVLSHGCMHELSGHLYPHCDQLRCGVQMNQQQEIAAITVNSIYANAETYNTLVKLWNPPSTAEIGFYSGMATGLKTPIFELGCGTGRLSVPLAKLGHAVTGIDCSEEMLSKARARAEAEGVEVEFVHADARNFTAEPGNGLIICPYNFLAYLYDFDDLRQFFASVRKSMGPRGFFIIDQDNPDASQLEGDPGVRRLIGACRTEQGGEVEIYESFSYDRATQLQLRTFFAHE